MHLANASANKLHIYFFARKRKVGDRDGGNEGGKQDRVTREKDGSVGLINRAFAKISAAPSR